MTGDRIEQGRLGEFRQFWSRQIAILVAAVLPAAVATLRFSNQIGSLSPAGLEAISTGFATLLGLTFTAFSIVATFML